MATTGVGKRIRELRDERGLKQYALARHAGISAVSLQSIELGARNPSLNTLAAIANALDVEPGELFPKAPTPSTRIPTLQELREVTDELERLIAWARGRIERWQEAGVSDVEDAKCTSYVLNRAIEQVHRDLQEFVPTDEIVRRSEELSSELVDAARQNINAYSRLIGVSAEARTVAYELSQKADAEAARGLEKLFALIEETREAPIRIRQEGGATHEA